jgi:molecular chaperone Hsp33
MPVEFYCNCSKERVEKVLISLGKKELTEMIADGEPIELNCHFCNRKYLFTVEEMEELVK